MPHSRSARERRVVESRPVFERLEGRALLSAAVASATPASMMSPVVSVTRGVNEGVDMLPGGITPAPTEMVTGSNGGNPLAPTPIITLLGASGGSGPHAVYVHALDSTLVSGTVLTARYQWDFGDPGSKYDQLVGWDAGHIYNNPGTYTITLTLTNQAGYTRMLTTTVTIAPPSYRTIYVDSVAGNDHNGGLSPSQPIKTVSRLMQLVGNNTQILFHAGETFNVNSSIDLPYQNMLIGSYGAGADPVMMRYAGVGTSVFSFLASSANIVVQNLTFDSPYVPVKNIADKPPADGIFPAGVNIAIRDCEFLNLDCAINEERNPQGTIVQDCTAPDPTGLRGCFIWGQGTDQVYLGNTVANSTREHIIRTVWVVRELIADNNLTNLDRTSVDPNDFAKGVIDVHRGSYAYVSDNYTYGGELRVGPRNGPAYVPGDTTQWCVVEGNHTFGHEVEIYPGTYHVMFRNNVFTENNDACVNIAPGDAGGDYITDVTFANNTGITTSVGGKMFDIEAGGRPNSITLINNLWIAPNIIPGMNGSAAVYIHGNNPSVIAESEHNVWQMPSKFNAYADHGINYVWPYWLPPHGYYTPQAWNALPMVSDDMFSQTTITADDMPLADTLAATAGVQTPGVFVDINGTPRPKTGPITAGAVQS